MRKGFAVALLLFVTLPFVTITSYATESVGGWTGTDSLTIPEEVQNAFYEVSASLDDMNYESVGLLSTQVVSGTNYCLLCRTRTPESDQAPSYCLMYIYIDLSGEASLQRIEPLAFSIDDDEPNSEENNTQAEDQPEEPAQVSETVENDNPTMGEKNAVDKAKSYLDFMAFSYSGLIEQLEYEGFSTEEATYGADHCGADWNEQAALKAESYLDFMSFSRSGLIEQLVYEGFSQEQAEYGATAVGY